jgi:hypothetical protein
MLDDLRNHDAIPTEQERAWMATNPFKVLLQVVALAGIAIAIGLSGSQMVQENSRPAAVASTTP